MAVDLSDLLPAPKYVSLGRGEAEVFGLDLDQVSALLSKYGTSLEPLFSQGAKPDLMAIAQAMPEVVNDVVAFGLRIHDAPNCATTLPRIPLSSKVEVLKAVWELSVLDPKKLEAGLRGLAETAKNLRVGVGA